MDHSNLKLEDILCVDTETRTSIDIKTAGTVKYATSAEMILGGFRLGDKYHVYDISDNPAIPDWVVDHIDSGGIVCAHNYLFDYLVLRQYLPNLTLEQGMDTAATCAAHSLPISLEKAGEALRLPSDKKKLADGKRLIRRFCIPGENGEYYTALTHPTEWARFREYLDNDIIAMIEIIKRVPPLTPFQYKTWLETQYINLEGIPMDMGTVGLILSKLNPLIDSESTKFIRITGLYPSQNMKILKWVNDNGYPLPNLQAPTIEEALADPNIPKLVFEALEARANTTHSSFKKFETMRESVMEDGRIRGCFQYHTATTGRWGGRLLQPHNLTKGKIDGEEAVKRIHNGEFTVELVKSAVRPMIHSPEGFTIADYSGIEARVVQWLVKDENALDVFRQGLDPYKWMAQRIYSIAYDDVTDRQRFAGKQAILGLGYSMSASKFQTTLKRYGEHMELKECKLIVDIYRETHHMLVDFWKQMAYGWLAGMRLGEYEVNEYISFKYDHPWLYMVLPSGRKLAYNSPDLTASMDLTFWTQGLGGKWGKESTYGGKLTENAVQAISADILSLAISRLKEHGYKIPLHVHDEIVVEGNIGVDNMISIMCELPDWAEGLPLTAAGEYVTRFKKL